MSTPARWSALFGGVMLWSSVLAGEVDPQTQPMKLQFNPRLILEAVTRRLNVKLRAEIPLPAIHFASSTPLKQLQEAIEAQWGFRPHVFGNTYALATNEIYLCDEPGFYLRHQRTLDDALAHEFVHYVQAQYWREDPSLIGREVLAVDVQRWFREEYMAGAMRAGQRSASAREQAKARSPL